MSSLAGRERPWHAQANRITGVLEEVGALVTGVYVHGSAALGGWTPASDLDVLITTPTADDDWPTLGAHLLAALAPTPVVELSVVTAAAAAAPAPPWPYLLHVNQAGNRVVADAGGGDPDLLMHYVVARHRGIAISGPPAGAAFGPVPRSAVLAYLYDEVAWGAAEADQRYAVLNACRALVYCRDGSILSKSAGGRWALRHGMDAALVQPALTAQAAGLDLGPCTATARTFARACTVVLRDEMAKADRHPPEKESSDDRSC